MYQQDAVTDAARRLCVSPQDLFDLWGRDINPQDAHNFGAISYSLWLTRGYQVLPDNLKDWLLKVCNGEYTYLRTQHRQLHLFEGPIPHIEDGQPLFI